MSFAASVSLSSLNGNNGFRVFGFGGNTYFGYSVAGAGDVNGDGFDDVIIGAYGPGNFGSDINSAAPGSSFVVFGKADGWTTNFNISTLNGFNGFRIDGAAAGDFSGISLASAGDVNHDGFADLIIGSYGADPNGANSGSSYVVFGKASGWSSSLNLSTLNGLNGFRLDGAAADDWAGSSVASAGDVNGDGFADLIVGARNADPSPNVFNAGVSYVVFGKANGWASSLNLQNVNGNNGFKLNGLALSQSGYSVASAGDVNGDGFADIVIGTPSASPNGSNSGSSYVVFGRADGWSSALELSALNGSNGFRLDGSAVDNFSGNSVASAGDVNGDGFADIIIGAYGPGRTAAGPASGTGSSYVVFGKANGWAPTVSLANLNGLTGFRLDGVAALDYSGYSVSTAGDVNGDGFSDVLVGAYRTSTAGIVSGTTYVILGKASGWTSTLSLAALNGTNGFRLVGAAGNTVSGFSVATAGDVNGDGFSDVLVGAYGAESGYVYFSPATGAKVYRGTSLADIAHGTLGGDVMSGYGRDDVLLGGAGDDIISGGAGNDTVDGGTGRDVAVFELPSSQAAITRTLTGYTVTTVGANPSLAGLGTDVLTSIETLRFTDRDVRLVSPTPHDVNGDGYADIVWRGPAGENVVWTLNGNSVTSATVLPRLATSWTPGGLADATGDGRSDLLWRGPVGETVLWGLNGGTVTLAAALPNLAPSWKVGGFADATGDGKADILWRGPAGETVLWGLDGGTVTLAAVLPSLLPSWTVGGFADMSGDGRADILWRGPAGENVVWIVNAGTVTSAAVLPGLITSWTLAGLADTTGDGKADVLWRGPSGETVLWAMDGATVTAAAVLPYLPTNWLVGQFQDSTGDGKADILWRGPSGETVLWGVDGTTVFSAAAVVNLATTWQVVDDGPWL